MFDIFFISGIIPPRVQLAAIVAGLFILLLVFELIRQGRLREGHGLVWLSISIITLIVAIFPQLLQLLANLFGISYPPSAFFLVLVAGLYLLGIHFSLLLHRHDGRIRHLAQEQAILKQEVLKKKDL